MVLTVKKEDSIAKGLKYPGVEQMDEMKLKYTSQNLMEIFKAFGNMY